MHVEDPRARYALAVLFDTPDLPGLTWIERLTYGDQPPSGEEAAIHIQASRFFDENYGTPSSLPTMPLPEIDGVPLLFGRPTVERRGNTLVVHADIIASTYFLVTRYEEWVRRGVRDEHGRFPGRESLPFRAGFLHRPIVDEYAALLHKWAGAIGISLPSSPQRRFSVLLTHDVDTLGPPRGPIQAVRRVASGLLGRRSMRQAMDGASVALGVKRDPCDNLDDVLQLDQQLMQRVPSGRCRSICFFMAGGHSPYDGDYDVTSKKIRNRLQQVASAGAEIGLHASYEAGIRPELVGTERRCLEKAAEVSIEKNRHHYLAWREPEHGAILAQAGIGWDATLGYADVAGFRLGVCRPIPLFDPIQQRSLGIEEHPLVVMDCTLDRPKYMNLDEQSAFECVNQLMDATYRYRGEFVALWHNTVLASNDGSYHKWLYLRVLNRLRQLIDEDPCVS
jgi:hypothetical protein